MPEITVSDNPAESRFEIYCDAELAGFAEYDGSHLDDGRIVFTHTEVDPRFEGHGVGGRLVRFALDDARARGLAVVPSCPFVRRYIREHPAYKDLVAHT